MKVYPTPGVDIEATRNGTGNTAAYIEQLDLGDSVYLDVPVQLEASTQTTKNGISRTMLKVTATLPRGLGVGTFSTSPVTSNPNKGPEENTLHCVMTLGPAYQALLSNSLQKAPAELLLRKLIGILIAMMADKDSIDYTIAGSGGTLLKGAQGLWPLDVENGAYGDSVLH